MTTVRIDRLASGGDGIGRLEDGRAVFVPRTAPGDLVLLGGVRRSSRFARARAEQVMEAGPSRVEPRCPHYAGDRCGGCQLQHLTPEAQRGARASFVGDAMRRIGKLDVSDPPLTPAPSDWQYRAKITLHAEKGGRRIGYHRADRPDELFNLHTCFLADPALDALWQSVSRHRRFLPLDLDALVLRLARDGSRHLVASGSPDGNVWTTAPALHTRLLNDGQPATLWWAPKSGLPRVVAGGDVMYPAMAFQQVHPAMGDMVRAHAVQLLGDVSGRHAWDLFAGIGETTELLRGCGATVESVELDHSAVQFAHRQSRPRGPEVERHQGSVEATLRKLKPATVAIANPPRAGLGAEVTDELRRRPPARLVYISCDPATLARDLAALVGVFAIEEVAAFDLFPQTAHVETVTLLVSA